MADPLNRSSKMNIEELQELGYKELQEVAKELNIKVTQKKKVLVEEIMKELEMSKEDDNGDDRDDDNTDQDDTADITNENEVQVKGIRRSFKWPKCNKTIRATDTDRVVCFGCNKVLNEVK